MTAHPVSEAWEVFRQEKEGDAMRHVQLRAARPERNATCRVSSARRLPRACR